ncbi:hypothetical protein GCM10011499_09600 [Pelagibacterium lentulum]|uniref:Uncharacterized protein n=1 Tax=Pelagibacterium lentulum TaxID=2029865 RepID=A0A916R894_9HYPH|nr:hypothetical protein GCM10011499_09600 [Pelagibacterium lentulum]
MWYGATLLPLREKVDWTVRSKTDQGFLCRFTFDPSPGAFAPPSPSRGAGEQGALDWHVPDK